MRAARQVGCDEAERESVETISIGRPPDRMNDRTVSTAASAAMVMRRDCATVATTSGQAPALPRNRRKTSAARLMAMLANSQDKKTVGWRLPTFATLATPRNAGTSVKATDGT